MLRAREISFRWKWAKKRKKLGERKVNQLLVACNGKWIQKIIEWNIKWNASRSTDGCSRRKHFLSFLCARAERAHIFHTQRFRISCANFGACGRRNALKSKPSHNPVRTHFPNIIWINESRLSPCAFSMLLLFKKDFLCDTCQSAHMSIDRRWFFHFE